MIATRLTRPERIFYTLLLHLVIDNRLTTLCTLCYYTLVIATRLTTLERFLYTLLLHLLKANRLTTLCTLSRPVTGLNDT